MKVARCGWFIGDEAGDLIRSLKSGSPGRRDRVVAALQDPVTILASAGFVDWRGWYANAGA